MIKNYVEWRVNKEKIFGQDFLKTYQIEREFVCNGIYHTDKSGDPVFYEMISQSNFKELFKHSTLEKLENYYCHNAERILKIVYPVCSSLKNKRLDTYTVVMDFKGVNIFKFVKGDTKKFMKLASEIGQNFYPEILKRLFIVNAPTMFYVLW